MPLPTNFVTESTSPFGNSLTRNVAEGLPANPASALYLMLLLILTRVGT